MSKIFQALEIASRSRQKEPSEAVPDLLEKKTPELGPELIVHNEPESVMADCLRFVRSRILKHPHGVPPRTILITSAIKGEGKTFVACNLAIAISQGLEEHVLLIDADLRKPRIHEVFNMPCPDAGLATCLSNGSPIATAIKKAAIPKLSLILAGQEPEAPAELLSSERMSSLIEEVRGRYPDRFVILDSAPLLMAPETAVIAKEVDAVILVAHYGTTPRDALKTAKEKIDKAKLLGVIFNGCDDRVNTHTRYGYYPYRHKKQ